MNSEPMRVLRERDMRDNHMMEEEGQGDLDGYLEGQAEWSPKERIAWGHKS